MTIDLLKGRRFTEAGRSCGVAVELVVVGGGEKGVRPHYS
jgi:hypothetical protein